MIPTECVDYTTEANAKVLAVATATEPPPISIAEAFERNGPGRVWTLGQTINVVTDRSVVTDSSMRHGDIQVWRAASGDHLRFYCWYCHEKAPRQLAA